jgi:Flp pilus assembly protein TadG
MVNPNTSPGAFGALLTDDSGVSALVVGLSMSAMMGFAGMAVDAGVWYADKRSAQGAADAAAFSAATDVYAGDTVSGGRSNAQAVAGQHGFTNGSNGVTVTVNSPPASGPNTSNTSAVEVIVSKNEHLFFSSLFRSSTSVGARAVAVSGSTGGGYCVEALNPSTSNSVTAAALQGNMTLNMTTCGIQVNAGGSSAMSLTGNATLNADHVSVVGGISKSGGAKINITSGGSSTTGAAAGADPYANVVMPTPAASCKSYSGGDMTEGTYCGLTIQGAVHMAPGTYFVKGGSFKVNAGANLTGSGVTIVLTEDSSGSYATTSINGNATITLSAPTSGATAGLVFMQDRNAPSSGTDTFNGGAAMAITGALYFPTQTVQYAGNSNGASTCTEIIAYDLKFTGDSNLNNNCAGTGVTAIGSSSSSLVE